MTYEKMFSLTNNQGNANLQHTISHYKQNGKHCPTTMNTEYGAMAIGYLPNGLKIGTDIFMGIC